MIEGARTRLPLLGWDVAFGCLLAFFALIGFLNAADESAGGVGLVTALAPLVCIGIVYVVLGRPLLRRTMTTGLPTRTDLFTLVLLVAGTGFAALVEPSYATLQCVIYPLIWVTLPAQRDSIVWSAGLALAVGVGSTVAYARHGAENPIGIAALVAVLSFGFAVVMGTWITRIHRAGERYRDLAEELRRSQATAAALAESAGAAAERERLSRELHDTLTQTLTGLVMLSEQAERALDAGDEARARDRVAHVGRAARDAVSEARALVATTQPLGEGGLEQALERITARFASDTGIVVERRIEAQHLDRERQVVLLRAAQEGLANARKHARATLVELALLSDDRGVLLRVDDDGCGPSGSGAEAPAGFGLSGLGDRVRTVGGSVAFGARPGGGARLEVRMPHQEPRDALESPESPGELNGVPPRAAANAPDDVRDREGTSS